MNSGEKSTEIDGADEAAFFDSIASQAAWNGQSFPRRCMLSDCYLKKARLFHNCEEYSKHVMRCLCKNDRRKGATICVEAAVQDNSVEDEDYDDENDEATVETPAEVSIDVSDADVEDYMLSAVSSSTDGDASSHSGSGSGSTHSGCETIGGSAAGDTRVAIDSPPRSDTTVTTAADVSSADGGRGGSNKGGSIGSITRRRASELASKSNTNSEHKNNDNNNSNDDIADNRDVGCGRGRLLWSPPTQRAPESSRATAGSGSRHPSDDENDTGRPVVVGRGSQRLACNTAPIASSSRRRASSTSREPMNTRRSASGPPRRAAAAPASTPAVVPTTRSTRAPARQAVVRAARTRTASSASASPAPAPAPAPSLRAERAGGEASAAENGSSGSSGGGGGSDVGGSVRDGSDEETEVTREENQSGHRATRSGKEQPTSWKGSLGSWGPSGGFTCPIKGVPKWGIPGCGKDSRARDTKCDSCNRVLRVDWQVGAAAAIGSGVENPQLKLSGEVTFESKNGITYTGKVVAIDPTPRLGKPRGIARVKNDDWPYDKYDEDVSMELVTPKGWVPTALGRAGRRASKPVKTFTPDVEACYRRRPPAIIDFTAAAAVPAVPATSGEGGQGAQEGTEGANACGYAVDDSENEEADSAGDGPDDEEEAKEEAPRAKAWTCKHIRQGQAVAINTLGLCRACHNAARRTRAGIKMCRHVRDGEARAYGRGPGDWGKGHCRECIIKRFPVKRVKLPKPRLFPTCAMGGCRRRHFGWGMCASCAAGYKERRPDAEVMQQSRRKNKTGKAGKPPFKYVGRDTEFTDSSEGETEPSSSPALKKQPTAEASAICPEQGDALAGSRGVTALPQDGIVPSEPDNSDERCPDKRDGALPRPAPTSPESGSCNHTGNDGKRTRLASTARQAKRARVSSPKARADGPTCFYCQKSRGANSRDKLLLCSDFDCSRSVHMRCATPSLDQVPARFYCPMCVQQGKDEACEKPCVACKSNDRDDLILVCDRDKCYSYFHCYCLPVPLDAPPEGEYVCPSCTGQDLEAGLVVAKTSGGVRLACRVSDGNAGQILPEKVRRCNGCSKRAAMATMWTCASGKDMCRGMTFHKSCLARGKALPAVSRGTSVATGKGARVAARAAAAAATAAKATASRMTTQAIIASGRVGALGAASPLSLPPLRAGGKVAMEIRDSENHRLCCPECGYDLLVMDQVDTSTKEEAYEGTRDEELAYKTFERALRMSLEDPRFGIGQTREEFEEPFKGSIGSGANRTAMYGSVFESAVDQMFRMSKLTAEHKFLDIGCGIGSIVLQAAAWAGCQAAGIEIVEDRYDGAVTLRKAFKRTVASTDDFKQRMHPDVIEHKVHLFKGCFLEQWENPEVRDADFIFFNNSSGWFNNSKALNNPDEHSLEARLLHRLKNDPRNNGKILITLEHIAEWQPDCWKRRMYKYSCNTKRAATYAANELEFWEYTVVSHWECPGCTSLNTDAVNDCIVCGTYCRNKRKSKRL